MAAYNEQDEARLLTDAGILDHSPYFQTVANDARHLLVIRERHGSFAA